MFFVQAKERIRYAQESRGVGDVYKRKKAGLENSTHKLRKNITKILKILRFPYNMYSTVPFITKVVMGGIPIF